MGKTGHRIWYGVAIFLSALVLLLSVAGIAGVWITERILADTIVQVLQSVDNVTGSLRMAAEGVDQKLESMQSAAIYISTAADRVSQNVTDQGLVKLLLPEEETQKLATLSTSVTETIGTLLDTLSSSLAIYQSIDQLPFINLPSPSQDQVDEIEASIGEIQSTVDNVQAAITSFRSGASDQINKIVDLVDGLSLKLGQVRDLLANLDARLAILQETLVQLQTTLVRILVLVSILFTLFLAWVIYSQVVVLRLYAQRWKASGTTAMIAESVDLPIDGGDATKNPPGKSSSENSDIEQTTG
jgi:methyl-accepting chemotaxis protein